MIFKLNDKITFGQYSAKKRTVSLTIAEIIDLDPGYLVWACDNIEWFELHHKAMEELQDAVFAWEDDEPTPLGNSWDESFR